MLLNIIVLGLVTCPMKNVDAEKYLVTN